MKDKIQTAPREFWYYIREDGEWINFQMGELNKVSKDFCLSEKRKGNLEVGMTPFIYNEEDVKEFIKRLKKEFHKQGYQHCELKDKCGICDIIDKLAGEKLI